MNQVWCEDVVCGVKTWCAGCEWAAFVSYGTTNYGIISYSIVVIYGINSYAQGPELSLKDS